MINANTSLSSISGGLKPNPYNIDPEVEKLETEITKETKNLRRLIYTYDNGTSHVKIFEEINPQTEEKKYWCEQIGIASSTVNAAQTITVTLIVKMQDKNYFALSAGVLGTSMSNLEWTHHNTQCINLTKASFQTSVARPALPKNWIVKGYADMEELRQSGII